MKKVRRWKRILFLSILCFTVLAPVLFLSTRLKSFSPSGDSGEFVEDLSSIKYRTDDVQLNSIGEEEVEGVKEPKQHAFVDKHLVSLVGYNSSNGSNDFVLLKGSADADLDLQLPDNIGSMDNSSETSVSVSNHGAKEDNQVVQQQRATKESVRKGQSNKMAVPHVQNVVRPRRRAANEKVKEMRDQLIRARAYLNFAPPGSNSQLVKDLRQRSKELEKAMGEVIKDSDLSRSALQKKRSMEVTLSKASRVFSDCSVMASKLRAMTFSAEEQLRAQKNQAAYLVHLAAGTTPKGLHCLSMQLTTEYFSLPPEQRHPPNQQRVHDPNLFHYAVFSDNVLASAVVVNSTISSAMDAEKIVFHVVTDSLNLPAMTMWFLLNPPGKATIQIESIKKFEGLFPKHKSTPLQHSPDPKYSSALNHLRFYLPDVFPLLKKIVLFDHDVVVKEDLTRLFSLDMKGKVNGAVETCQESQPSFQRMDMLVNFSEPFVSERFDAKACTWAFGMNLFDLQRWRKQNLTDLYLKYLQMGYEKPLWKSGSLPLGWATFYNQTVALDRRWHVLGLGYESGASQEEIEHGAVLHYDGVMKPWLDIGIGGYKSYWIKYVDYDHPYLQQCNIHM